MEAYAQLLGAPRIRFADVWHDPPLTKANALLYYLAYRGEWCSRDALLFLFYADIPENVARSNLRQRLSVVRRLPYCKGLETEGPRLRWPIETDVQVFKTALQEGDYARAVELYQGRLLEGCTLSDSPEFEAWLEAEREELHGQWRDAVFALATELEDSKRYPQAGEVLERLYKTDSLDEEALQRYLQALSLSGQRSRALEVFERFKKRLHEDYEGEPEGETLQIVERIEQSKHEPEALLPAKLPSRVLEDKQARHNLPVQPTPFVGRDEEQAKLSQLLGDPSCRLLTVVGPGGIGKTRLAVEVARHQINTFEDGVYFVNFVPVASPDLMVYTIGQAIDFSFFGQQEPKEQLLDYFKDKEMLLLLDNLEHLLSDIELVSAILERAPNVKLFATSRLRLDLRAERVYDLHGLAVPDEDAQEARGYDAIQLFTQSARSVRHDFDLNDVTLPTVIRVCRLVRGMPLAIELAASWLRALPVEDIATEIERGIDVLEASTRDLPDRHQSIRAVFDYSWRLLTEEEQQVLRKLAVFQGGFRREAATEIAGASLPVLASLVDKSFLTLTPTGRYRRHPLVLQYTQEKLSEYPEEGVRAAERHGLYYLHLIREREADLRTLKRKETLAALEEELPNIRAAWLWAVEDERVNEIKASVVALNDIYTDRDNEGFNLLAQAVAGLDIKKSSHQAALGYIFILQGQHVHMQAKKAETSKRIQQGIELLRPLGETSGVIDGLYKLGFIAWFSNDLISAKTLYQEGLALAKVHGHNTSRFLLGLVLFEREISGFPEVKRFFQDTLTELQKQGSAFDVSMCKVEFGLYLVRHSFLLEGKKLIEEGIQLARELSLQGWELIFTNGLVLAAYKLGDYDLAEALTLRVLEQLQHIGGLYKMNTAKALAQLGRVATARGDTPKATGYLKESLKLSLSAYPFLTLEILIYLSELATLQGRTTFAAELLSLVRNHPACWNEHRLELEPLLEKLTEQLSPQELEAALERGRQTKLEEVVEDLLHDWI